MKRIVYLLTSLALGLVASPMAPTFAATNSAADGLDAKIVQLSKKGSTVEDVIAALGEPKQYLWGEKIFEKGNLPATYILQYPKGLHVMVSRGEVAELRAKSRARVSPGAGSFAWAPRWKRS